MPKTLVAYFSAQGNTKQVAETLAQVLSAALYEIKAMRPYTAADLNWQDAKSRTSVEMHDPASRPELADTDAPVNNYERIFLGFPIWWYVAPTIINTFLESYTWTGKTIILFATSGGSGFGKALENLQKSAPGAQIYEGQIFKRTVTANELASFAKKFD
ncbi:MAG: NAD(P)H-dependent oxidoreductase [Desulfovibrionaceae bacterium]|nr:NAD(P)H-dependent oxidoreductase [Desulfovibrionaceae bacterium]